MKSEESHKKHKKRRSDEHQSRHEDKAKRFRKNSNDDDDEEKQDDNKDTVEAAYVNVLQKLYSKIDPNQFLILTLFLFCLDLMLKMLLTIFSEKKLMKMRLDIRLDLDV